MDADPEEIRKFISSIDVQSVAGEDDKADECRFFLGLARMEIDKKKFRWLVSAFLGAAYSYFEHTAHWACIARTDHDTGEDIADEALLSAVREHVDVIHNKKYPSHSRTVASREVLRRLYEVRHENTHRCSLSIMSAGLSLPDGFHLGWEVGRGIPLLEFCEKIMVEVGQLQWKRDACAAGAWPPRVDPPWN